MQNKEYVQFNPITTNSVKGEVKAQNQQLCKQIRGQEHTKTQGDFFFTLMYWSKISFFSDHPVFPIYTMVPCDDTGIKK